MKIFKKIVYPEYSKRILNVLTSTQFRWFYNKTTFNDGVESNHLDCFQLTHSFVNNGSINSDYFHLISPIIALLEIQTGKSYFNNIHRVKSNMMTQQYNYDIDDHNPPHIDIVGAPGLYESFLYYVNDSDGDTFFFNESEKDYKGDFSIKQRISPVSGDGILFDSDMYHASSPPRKKQNRMVINFVFRKNK